MVQVVARQDSTAALVSVNAASLDALLPYAALFRGFVTDLVVISCLFGIVVMLTCAAIYVLIRKGLHLRSSRILLAATVTLFASTTVYFAYELAYAAVAARISTDVALALTASPTAPLPVDAHMLGHAARFDAVLTCVSAVTVTVNVTVGDAIVWWRAISIWPGNKLVRIVGPVLVITFLSLGITMSVQSRPDRGFIALENPVGLACAMLSLVTNVLSTCLIAYKAWEHWRFMRAYMGKRKRGTQAVRMLALLTESGFAYCALWALIIAYELVAQYAPRPLTPAQERFAAGMYVVVHICSVSLIAIYPMVIIVIVALDRSPIERVTECLATVDLHALASHGCSGGGCGTDAHMSFSPRSDADSDSELGLGLGSFPWKDEKDGRDGSAPTKSQSASSNSDSDSDLESQRARPWGIKACKSVEDWYGVSTTSSGSTGGCRASFETV